MSEITTIRILKKTRDRLAQLGRKADTYDDILNKVLAVIEKKRLLD